jgi:hypothetical protein
MVVSVSISAINQHLKRIFADNKLEPGATVKKSLRVQSEGSREVRREVEHYNLLSNKVALAATFFAMNDSLPIL